MAQKNISFIRGEKMITHNSEIELAVLGAILLNQTLLEEADLTADHFSFPKNKLIFNGMINTINKGIDLDYITLSDTLGDKVLESLGEGYLMKLAEHIATFENFKSHVIILKSQYVERKGKEIAEELQSGKITAETAAELLNKLHMEPQSNELPDLKEDLLDYFDELTSDETAIKTNFKEFDRLTDGLHGGELVIIGARPAMGKTAFSLNLASNIMKSSRNPEGAIVAFFSLEMSKNDLYGRIMSMHTGINSMKIRKANERFNGQDWDKASMFLGNFSDSIFYSFDNVTHLSDILRKIRLIRAKHKEEKIVIIVDHIGLVNANGSSRNEIIGEITRKLKLLTLELDINIVALSQLSRGVENRQDKRPVLADLRESGNIEQDADLIAFLYRDDYYNQENEQTNITEIIVSKHRRGDIGVISLYFQKETSRFINIDMRKGD